MKNLLWLLVLAAVAVLLALLLGDNQALVSLFWPPWRVDIAFNLALLGLVLGFALLYLALRGLATLRSLPQRAQRWRQRQMEKAAFVGLLDALVNQLAGRFKRAQSSASTALDALQRLPVGSLAQQARWLQLARLLLAESAHCLGDAERRDALLAEAVADPAQEAASVREAALLRASAWALEARDVQAARHWWQQLPQGAARRIQALRLRLKLAQLERDSLTALELVRQLAKHRAFSAAAAASLSQNLARSAMEQTHDSAQLLRVWHGLQAPERADPSTALAFLQHGLRLVRVPGHDPAAHNPAQPAAYATQDPSDGAPATEALHARGQALRTLWDAWPELEPAQQLAALRLLQALLPMLDASWLARIEAAQQASPADAGLQYLAAQAMLHNQLWGKAQQLLHQASRSLSDPELLRRTWCALAQLAQQRGDSAAAGQAWERAAQCAAHDDLRD